jgi:hypothetical protein
MMLSIITKDIINEKTITIDIIFTILGNLLNLSYILFIFIVTIIHNVPRNIINMLKVSALPQLIETIRKYNINKIPKTMETVFRRIHFNLFKKLSFMPYFIILNMSFNITA